MKKLTFAKPLAIASLAAVCALGVSGCSSSGDDGSTQTYTGGVAATVNGSEIQEDTITQAIEDIRVQMSLTDADAWGEWMAENDYTPESVREEIIDSYVDQELIKQAGEEMGLTADEETVNGYVDSMKGNYDSDEAWNDALQQVGMTEDEYRENIELSLVSQQIQEQVTADVADPTDDEVLESAKTYVSSYDGAKRASHILFAASDESQAQEVLEKLRSGDLDFAKAVQTYSTDSTTAENGGDAGWDMLNTFDTDYSTALDELEKGDISDLVSTSNGIYIIQCTDVFKAPEELKSLDELPSEFQDSVKESLKSSNESEAYYNWLDEKREAADIQINDMPDGLPYYVDMANYETEDEDAEATDATDGQVVTVDEDGNLVMDEDAVTTEGDDAADESAEAETTDESAEADADAENADTAAEESTEGAAGEDASSEAE